MLTLIPELKCEMMKVIFKMNWYQSICVAEHDGEAGDAAGQRRGVVNCLNGTKR